MFVFLKSTKNIITHIGFLGLLFLLITPAYVYADFKSEIDKKSQEMMTKGKLLVGERELVAPQFANGIYLLNDYVPLWNKSNTKEILAALKSLDKDGLNPSDYIFAETLQRLERSDLTDKEQLELDLLLTEGLIRALYNLAFGKVDAATLDPDINFSRRFTGNDLKTVLLDHIKEGKINELLELARPEQPSYKYLMEGLAKYKAIQKSGGWESIPDGEVLKPGISDQRIPILRQRLSKTGDYSGDTGSEIFDDNLKQSVISFQKRHGIDADGVIGKGTLAVLNIPVENRINQIKVNLERLRWYLHKAVGEFIVVDIAGFHVYWLKDGEIIWDEIAQVGKDYTSTPVFTDQIEYIEINPTWTIPPGILKRSVIPGIKKDPEYFTKKGYDLLTQDGKKIDPDSVNWSDLKGFPYIVRQPPGPNNALGLVKFMFPNKHFVFLHDTNHRELFDRTQRTFSSGCVRVNKPFDLAEKLLEEKKDWSREKIDEVVASGKTTRVNLEKPMPIIIAYTTALSRDGTVYFKEDVYKRDDKVLKALGGEFKLRKQDKN